MLGHITNLFIVTVFVTVLFYSSTGVNYISYELLFLQRILIIVAIIISSFKFLIAFFYDNQIKKNIKSFFISTTIILFMFLTFETVFMFIPKTHGVGYSLSNKVWNYKYGSNSNSLGFRDEEPSKLKPLILFVGDSFTWGQGIDKNKNRFSDIVRKKQNKYSTSNIGICGYDTKNEYDALMKFVKKTSIKPEKIILQYFGNDIFDVAKENGLIFTVFKPYSELNLISRALIEGSFLLNYIYWLYPHNDSRPYIDHLTNAYNESRSLKAHKNDLNKFIKYSKDNSIELIVVIFPFLQDLTLSKKLYCNKIDTFFTEKNIKTIDITKILSIYETKELVVNKNDAHPSEFLNHIVASEIIKIINQD